MAGLRRILKMGGSMYIQGVLWVWDYAKDEPRKRSEMTHDEWLASERAKWEPIMRAKDAEGDTEAPKF